MKTSTSENGRDLINTTLVVLPQDMNKRVERSIRIERSLIRILDLQKSKQLVKVITELPYYKYYHRQSTRSKPGKETPSPISLSL